MVGLGVDLGDIVEYVGHNDLGTAELLRALAAERFVGRLVLASSMVVYGEGRYRCPRHGMVRPGAREPAGFRAEVGLEDGMAEFATAPLRPTGGGQRAPRGLDGVVPRA